MDFNALWIISQRDRSHPRLKILTRLCKVNKKTDYFQIFPNLSSPINIP